LKVLANKCEIWEEWLGRRFGEQATKSEKEVAVMQDRVLQHMGLDLDCCRRMFLALPDTVLPYVKLRPLRSVSPIPLPRNVRDAKAVGEEAAAMGATGIAGGTTEGTGEREGASIGVEEEEKGKGKGKASNPKGSREERAARRKWSFL